MRSLREEDVAVRVPALPQSPSCNRTLSGWKLILAASSCWPSRNRKSATSHPAQGLGFEPGRAQDAQDPPENARQKRAQSGNRNVCGMIDELTAQKYQREYCAR